MSRLGSECGAAELAQIARLCLAMQTPSGAAVCPMRTALACSVLLCVANAHEFDQQAKTREAQASGRSLRSYVEGVLESYPAAAALVPPFLPASVAVPTAVSTAATAMTAASASPPPPSAAPLLEAQGLSSSMAALLCDLEDYASILAHPYSQDEYAASAARARAETAAVGPELALAAARAASLQSTGRSGHNTSAANNNNNNNNDNNGKGLVDGGGDGDGGVAVPAGAGAAAATTRVAVSVETVRAALLGTVNPPTSSPGHEAVFGSAGSAATRQDIVTRLFSIDAAGGTAAAPAAPSLHTAT
eukprot:UC1_evm1s1812